MLSLVIETSSSWSGIQTIFRKFGTNSSQYIYYSGTLQNDANSYVPGINLNTSTFYLITHIIDLVNGSETFQVKENGQTVEVYTSFIATPADLLWNHMFSFSGAVTPVRTFKTKVGETYMGFSASKITNIGFWLFLRSRPIFKQRFSCKIKIL